MATAAGTATPGTPVFASRPHRTAYRAVVAHPVPLVREGIASLLSAGGRAEEVATGNVLEAVRIAGLRAAELVLFDYAGTGGAGACRLLRAAAGDTTLVALVSSAASGPGAAIGSGADAVIAVDQVTGDAFLEAIRRAEDGERPAVAGFAGPGQLQERAHGVPIRGSAFDVGGSRPPEAYLSRSAAPVSAAWAAASRATGTRNGEHET